MKIKYIFDAIIACVGSVFICLFGTWDGFISTLLICMGIDFLTGLIVAGVFKKSPKTDGGKLESRAGWKGLCRKGITLLIVLISYRLDVILSTSYIRDATIIAFTVNEILSIIENAGLMGIPMPTIITKAIEILKNKEVDIE